MYIITQTQWDKIGDDFKTEKSITHGGRACFERSINPNAAGTALLFEGLHFIILPEEYTTGDAEKDRITCDILEGLIKMSPEQREAWREAYTNRYGDRPGMADYLPLAVKVAGDLAE